MNLDLFFIQKKLFSESDCEWVLVENVTKSFSTIIHFTRPAVNTAVNKIDI